MIFQKRGIPAVITDSSSGRGIDNCIKEIEKIMEEQLLLQANKGRIGRKIRAMVLGIPNLGHKTPGVSNNSILSLILIHCFCFVTPGLFPTPAVVLFEILFIKDDFPKERNSSSNNRLELRKRNR